MLFKFKYLVSVITLLLFCKTGFNQTYTGGVGIGYGLYQMTEMKEFQENLKNSIDITNLASVESFPGFIFYTAQFSYLPNEKLNSLGIEFNYYMTGARNHAADYSGEYILDINLNGYRLGFNYKLYIDKIGSISMFVKPGAGGLFNEMELNEKLTVFDEEIFSESYSLHGFSAFIEPKVVFSLPVSDKFNVEFDIAYEYDFPNKINLKGEKDKILYLGYQNPLSIQWSGLKLGIDFIYIF